MEPGNREAFEALQSQVREVRQVNHTVRAGDSLTSIAQLYYGDRTRSEVIWETNQLPPNPKLTPGMVWKIPEIPGLSLGRPEPPAPTAKTPPSGSFPATTAKTETSEEGLYANPALGAARLRMANSLWRYRPSTVFSDKTRATAKPPICAARCCCNRA